MAAALDRVGRRDERLYEALLSRDARFDGQFFVAVRTTGIYCRPICPAPKPRPGNCRFYRTAAEAEGQGFRPCKRCRPETAPRSAAWLGTSATVRRAMRLISEGALDEGTVEGLAARLGVGARHLRRLFDRHVGAAPSQVAATQRLHLARQLLGQGRLPVAEVAAASGYASLRRFNAAFKATYGSPPSAVRRRLGPAEVPDASAPITLVLGYAPPFDWDGLLDFLGARAIPGVEAVEDGRYARSFELAGLPGRLRAANDPRRNAVVVDVCSDGVASLLPAVERLRALFDLDAAPAAPVGVLGAEGALATLVAAAPGLRVPGCWDPFELTVRAVLGQQITVAAARTLSSRLVQRWGRALSPAGTETGTAHLFPTADALAEAEIEAIGVPRRRAETLRGLSRAVAGGALRLDAAGDHAAIAEDLLRLPGIGPWTVGYVALRALKDPDAFPVGDIALLRAAQGLAIAETWADLARASETWRPWRAYAVMHLWRSLARPSPR